MFIRIEPASSTPIYRQVTDQIRYQIATGVLKPNQQVPSVRALAAQVGVNQNTILKVYNELCRENVFRIERGSGTFVCDTGESADMSDTQKTLAITPLLSQVAVQSIQMGISARQLHKLLDEQLKEISDQANSQGSNGNE